MWIFDLILNLINSTCDINSAIKKIRFLDIFYIVYSILIKIHDFDSYKKVYVKYNITNIDFYSLRSETGQQINMDLSINHIRFKVGGATLFYLENGAMEEVEAEGIYKKESMSVN